MERRVTIAADLRRDVSTPEEFERILGKLQDLQEELGIVAPSLTLWENGSSYGGNLEQAMRFLKGDRWWQWKGEISPL